MKRPLVFLAVSLFLGCFCSFLFLYNYILAVFIAAFFLIIILFTVDKRYIVQIIAFFIMGIISVSMYFNFNINRSELNRVRVVEKNQYYIIASYNKRKLILTGNVNNLSEGKLVNVKGRFTKEFNYSKGIVGSFNVKSYKIQDDDIIAKLSSFKIDLYNNFSKYLDKNETAFIMAICFGDTNYLDQEQKHDFQKLGVIHAISVSGFHLAVIYKIIERCLGIYPSIILSLLYTVFTGNKPPTVRAFLMILFLKISKKFNKNYDSLSSIALSSMLILILKPFYVLDVGFILSYLSTLSIILFNNKASRKLIFLPQKLNEMISISISSQILSLPYAAFCLKNISTGFMLGNLFLLPFYTGVVILGNLALLFINVKKVFTFLCGILNILLTSINGATSFLIKICPPIKYFTSLESYALTFFVIAILLVRKGKKKAIIIPLALSSVLLLSNYSIFPEVIYVNYGKSDSIIIKYKKSTVLITDETGGKKIKDFKNEFRTTTVLSAKDGNNTLILGEKYKVDISAPQYYEDKMKTMKVELNYSGKRILFTRKNQVQAFSMNNKNYYDIIVVPENIKSQPLDFNTTNVHLYLIVFGKVFSF